jgi:hypothetical protein
MSKVHGPTWNSSHEFGQGLRNISRKLYYCQIPKCASMWVRKYLEYLNPMPCPADNWLVCNANTPDITDYTPLIVLRDPVKRWLSNCPAVGSIVEIASNKRQSEKVFETLDLWLYDEHAARQVDFVQWLDLSKAVFFYCDEHLSANMEHYFNSQGFTNTSAPATINQQSSDEVTIASVAAWRKLFAVSKYANVFQQTYARDYELINTVNFYRQGELSVR